MLLKCIHTKLLTIPIGVTHGSVTCLIINSNSLTKKLQTLPQQVLFTNTRAGFALVASALKSSEGLALYSHCLPHPPAAFSEHSTEQHPSSWSSKIKDFPQ